MTSVVRCFTAGRNSSRARLLVLCLLVALSACRWPGAGHRDDGTLRLSGTVEARETELAFQIPGRIAEMKADEGDAVQVGQAVARLDPGDYRLAASRAAAEAEAAGQALAALKAGSRPQEVKAAEAVVAQAEAQLKFARAETQRVAKLVPRQLASQDQLDRVRLQEHVAETGLAQAQQQLALVKEGPRKEDVARARAVFQASQQAAAAAERQLGYVDLASPVTGAVTVRLAEPGEVVAAGRPILRVTSLQQPWVRAYVNETDLARIRLGEAAQVKVDGSEKSFPGRISFISPEAEFTPKTVETRELRVDLVYRIKVEVDNPGGVLKVGMPADVVIPPAGS